MCIRDSLGTTEVRHHQHARACSARMLNRRQRRAYSRVARHDAVLHRHVQILADQHALAAQVEVGHSQNRHRQLRAQTFDHASVVSSMRLEKPHSLSYHAQTLTVVSMTLVMVASYTEECGSWLKSTETSGPSVYARIPLSAPFAAAFITVLISSIVVARFAWNVRSTSDTLIVGTRTEKPSSLPLSSGSTRPTAAAAPVLVGIMDCVAERARRRSLWNTSVSTWSLV